MAGALEVRLASALVPVVALGRLAERVQYGCSKLATSEPNGLPIIRMANLQPDGWDFSDLKYVALNVMEKEVWRLNRGDILFNRTNSKELVGKCEVFDEPGDWVFASYMIRLDLDRAQARPAFVSAYLNGSSGRAQIERDSRQIIGMTNINAEEIRALRIPLPNDLDAQDALLADLDAARTARDAGLRAADTLLSSVNAFVFAELGLILPPLRNTEAFAIKLSDASRTRIDTDYHAPRFGQLRAAIEKSAFETRSVKDLCKPLITGFAAGSNDQAEEANGVPHLRPTNVTAGGTISLAGSKYVPANELNDIDFISRGEVLFNNTNSSAWVGKSAVFDLETSCTCSNHMTRLRLRDRKHSPVFLAALLNALRSSGYFAALATNYNNQAGINSDALGALRLPVPNGEIQNAIAAEVDQRRAEARRLTAAARTHWVNARQAFEDALLAPVL